MPKREGLVWGKLKRCVLKDVFWNVCRKTVGIFMSLAPSRSPAGQQNLFVFLHLRAFSDLVSQQVESSRTVGVLRFACLLRAFPLLMSG